MNAETFYPYGDRILIEVIPAETEVNGIILPEVAQERPVRGTVVRAGPGMRNEQTGERVPLGVEAGDVVVFSKYGGVDVNLGGDYLLIREADVLGVETPA